MFAVITIYARKIPGLCTLLRMKNSLIPKDFLKKNLLQNNIRYIYNTYLELILTLLNAAKFSLFDELCQFL